MKALLSTSILFFLTFTLYAQGINVGTVSSGGGVQQASDIHLEFSIGQAFIANNNLDSEHYQEGILTGAFLGTLSSVYNPINEYLELQVYPNPSSDFIVLNKAYYKEEGVLRIFNVKGQIVMNTPYQSGNTLSISHLETGRYWLEFKRPGSRRRSQFIKI